MRNLFPLSGKVYALEVMVEKRNQFDMSYSKRDGGKGGIMVYTLWLLATPQKYTIRAIVRTCYQPDFFSIVTPLESFWAFQFFPIIARLSKNPKNIVLWLVSG